jgi:hypothetical protein
MNRELAQLEARLRQLHAADRNAADIYHDLLKQAPDSGTEDVLRQLAADEARHVALDREMVRVLESYTGEKPL